MDPEFERRFTDEVIYLHSLWQRGPPTNPNPDSNHSVAPPETSISRKRPRKQRVRKIKNQDSGPEWPCPEPASTSSEWPPIVPCPTPPVQLVSSEERVKLAALQLQYKEFESCRKLFSRNVDSGSEGEESDDDDDELEESEEYKHFLKMFVENSDLRNYYERNSENGCFCCLVCGGIGRKNAGKKFKSCVGIVQHSVAISKTQKRRAHKAFGHVICRVFGWDFDRLPMIVLKGEPLGRSLADSGNPNVQTEANHNENGASLNVINCQKNELISPTGDKDMISVDGNELRFEKEDPDFNAEDLISGELEASQNENVASLNDKNVQESELISPTGDKDMNSVDGNELGLEKEKEKKAEDPDSNAKESLSVEVQPEANDEENVASLNDNNGQMIELISSTGDKDMNYVNGNELGLEKEKTAEVPDSNANKESLSVEVQPEANHNENVASLNDNNGQMNELISPTGDKDMNSVDGNDLQLEKEKTAEDPCSNAEESIPGVVLQSILDACKEFFAGSSSSKNDDDRSVDNLKDGDGLEECEEYKFFFKLFTENEDLRRYHENSHENGEFCCLVCEGSRKGNRVLKRYNTFVGLLQHSTSMAKTKKKLAHRVYSLVLCRVLGRSLAWLGAPKDESVADLKDLDSITENHSTLQRLSMVKQF